MDAMNERERVTIDRRAAREQQKHERNLKTADAVIKAMRGEGVALFVTHLANTSLWQLSDGTQVSEAAAGIVIAHPNIIDVGDCLIGDRRASQTFRFIEPEEAPAH
jgi:hypothetical protein